MRMRFHKEVCPFVGNIEFCSTIKDILKTYAELNNFVVNVFSCTDFDLLLFEPSNLTPVCRLAKLIVFLR